MTKHKHVRHPPAEHWLNEKWRPAMGWMYMAICIFDFMIAPILWSVLQSRDHGQITSQWQPLTLQGAGLFHLAMGAILGITAYGRTQEKLNGSSMLPSPTFGSNSMISPSSGINTSYVQPNTGFPAMNNQPNSGFNNTQPQSGFPQPKTPMTFPDPIK